MEEELCRLRSQAELQRMQASVIATLEGERATLERERETLRSYVDTLRTAQRKVPLLQYTHYALQNTHITTNRKIRTRLHNVTEYCDPEHYLV